MVEKKAAKRKKPPKKIAVVGDGCSGCSGSPVCQGYCPVEGCMTLQPAGSPSPFWKMWVDPEMCIGCGKCITKGSSGNFLDGCPWEAIALVDNPDYQPPSAATTPPRT